MAIDPRYFDSDFYPKGSPGKVITKDGLVVENVVYLFAWIGIEEFFSVQVDGQYKSFWYEGGDRFIPDYRKESHRAKATRSQPSGASPKAGRPRRRRQTGRGDTEAASDL